MARRSSRINLNALADDFSVDHEELLFVLSGDFGINEDSSLDTPVTATQAEEIRALLGYPTLRQQQTIDYWIERLGLDRTEFADELRDIGYAISPGQRRLPKGALKKLRRQYLSSATASNELVSTDGSSIDARGSVRELTERRKTGSAKDIKLPFRWKMIGASREIDYLTVEDVLSIHHELVRAFAEDDDPISPPGVRSQDLLESALERPKTGLAGERKYGTVELAGAALIHSLVLDHPFYNGNKRTGLVSLLAFLDKHSFMPTCTEEQLFQTTLDLAAHRLVAEEHRHAPDESDREVQKLALWIRKYTRRIDVGEKRLPWRRVERILRSYGCSIETTGGFGDKVKLTRRRPIGSRLRGRREQRKLLVSSVYTRGDGYEIDKQDLRNIRKDLQLDEEHGIDSRVFYEAEAEPDEFIQKYRTVLRRLAQY